MRLPGFVAEASLLGIDRSRRRRTPGGGARHVGQTPGTIMPQQGLGVGALHVPVTFLSPCYQRCAHEQQVAQIECLGNCRDFLGPARLQFIGTCTSNCAKGLDYEFGERKLLAPLELQPGYCGMRCGLLARLHIPPPHVGP